MTTLPPPTTPALPDAEPPARAEPTAAEVSPPAAGVPRWLGGAAMALLIAVASVLRFLNLGRLCYQVDEGYQLAGVKGILEHGVPRLASGYAYPRAPVFLYLEAWCAQVFGLGEFAMRLPAAVFGVLCVPIGYWFGRRLVSPPVGWALAAFFAVSQWHVEMSRYARFYTLFAAAVMLALIAFHHGYVRRKTLGKVAYWALAVLIVSLHDAGVGIGLVFLTLLPWRGPSLRTKVGYVVQAGLVGVAWIGFRQWNKAWQVSMFTRDIELTSKARTDVVVSAGAANSRPVWLPDVALPDFANTIDAWAYGGWIVVGAAVVALLSLAAAAWSARKCRRWGMVAAGGAVLLCVVLHQAAVATVLTAAALGWWVRRRRDLNSPLGWCLLGSILVLGWYAFVNVKLLHYGRVQGVVYLFAYPDWSRYVLIWLYRGWPAVLAALPLGLLLLLWRGRDEEGRPGGPWLIVGFLLLGMCLGGLAEGKFNESRYFFHLYVCLLTAYAAVWTGAASWLADRLRAPAAGWLRAGLVAAAIGGAVAVSVDLRPTQAWGVTQRGYDDTRDPFRGVFNWFAFADFHEDVESVGVYVAENRRPGDRVLSIGPPHRAVLVDHYVGGGLDYVVARPRVFTIKRVDDAGHWREPVTDAQIVDTPARLRAVVDDTLSGGGRLWVVSNERMTVERPDMLVDPPFAAVLDRLTPGRAAVGRDGSSFAALAVSLNDPESP